MRKLLLSLLTIGMIAGLSNNAMAQVTASATATATIVAPITIDWVADMNFGTVAVTSTAGTVVLAPAGSRTLTGGVTLPVVTGTVAAASFTVGGEGAYTYVITLPATPAENYIITNTTGSGGETMIVNTFTSTPSTTGTLSSGTQTLNVGATLNVTGSQVPGVYTNATGFDVTVNYN